MIQLSSLNRKIVVLPIVPSVASMAIHGWQRPPTACFASQFFCRTFEATMAGRQPVPDFGTG